MSPTCESCGADEQVLYAVRRRYVTPESWDTPGTDRLMAEVEHWCFACCTHYPHEPVEDDIVPTDAAIGNPAGAGTGTSDTADSADP